jgi:hypothetical protein
MHTWWVLVSLGRQLLRLLESPAERKKRGVGVLLAGSKWGNEGKRRGAHIWWVLVAGGGHTRN